MSVSDIWHESHGFNRYRGTGWMKEPCHSCPEKEKDFGGCRCQAYMLTNDPNVADPVCDKSPYHHLVQEAIATAESGSAGQSMEQPIIFRGHDESIRLSAEQVNAANANESEADLTSMVDEALQWARKH